MSLTVNIELSAGGVVILELEDSTNSNEVEFEFQPYPNVHTNICPICSDSQLVKWSEDDLKHQCCQSCRNQYIADLVTKGHWEIDCFMSGCHEKLRSERVSDELRRFQPDLAAKWESTLTRRYLLGVKDVIWCPGPNCNSATISTDFVGCQSIKCQYCSTLVCPYCKGQRHKGTKCVSFPTLEGVKLCPTCGVHIERIEGCPAMICTICGQKFCWTCGQPRESDHNHNQPQPVNVPNEQNVTEELNYSWPTNPYIKWPLHLTLLLLMPIVAFIYGLLLALPMAIIFSAYRNLDESDRQNPCLFAMSWTLMILLAVLWGIPINLFLVSHWLVIYCTIATIVKCVSYRGACELVEGIISGKYIYSF